MLTPRRNLETLWDAADEPQKLMGKDAPDSEPPRRPPLDPEVLRSIPTPLRARARVDGLANKAEHPSPSPATPASTATWASSVEVHLAGNLPRPRGLLLEAPSPSESAGHSGHSGRSGVSGVSGVSGGIPLSHGASSSAGSGLTPRPGESPRSQGWRLISSALSRLPNPAQIARPGHGYAPGPAELQDDALTFSLSVDDPVGGAPVRWGDLLVSDRSGTPVLRTALLFSGGLYMVSRSSGEVQSFAWSPFSILTDMPASRGGALLPGFSLSLPRQELQASGGAEDGAEARHDADLEMIFTVMGLDATARQQRWLGDLSSAMNLFRRSLFPQFAISVEPLQHAGRIMAGYLLRRDGCQISLLYCELRVEIEPSVIMALYPNERCESNVGIIPVAEETPLEMQQGLGCSCFRLGGISLCARSVAERDLWVHTINNARQEGHLQRWRDSRSTELEVAREVVIECLVAAEIAEATGRLGAGALLGSGTVEPTPTWQPTPLPGSACPAALDGQRARLGGQADFFGGELLTQGSGRSCASATVPAKNGALAGAQWRELRSSVPRRPVPLSPADSREPSPDPSEDGRGRVEQRVEEAPRRAVTAPPADAPAVPLHKVVGLSWAVPFEGNVHLHPEDTVDADDVLCRKCLRPPPSAPGPGMHQMRPQPVRQPASLIQPMPMPHAAALQRAEAFALKGLGLDRNRPL